MIRRVVRYMTIGATVSLVVVLGLAQFVRSIEKELRGEYSPFEEFWLIVQLVAGAGAILGAVVALISEYWCSSSPRAKSGD